MKYEGHDYCGDDCQNHWRTEAGLRAELDRVSAVCDGETDRACDEAIRADRLRAELAEEKRQHEFTEERSFRLHEAQCAMSTAGQRMADEIDRLRAHSVELNRVGFRMAEILGLVGPGDDHVAHDPDRVELIAAKIDRLRADRDSAQAYALQCVAERDAARAELARTKVLLEHECARYDTAEARLAASFKVEREWRARYAASEALCERFHARLAAVIALCDDPPVPSRMLIPYVRAAAEGTDK